MQENLHQQSEEMKKQMELEEEKSNTDDEKLEDMKQQYHDALEASGISPRSLPSRNMA